MSTLAAASPGLWALAWRRLRRDRVGMVSMVVVGAYLAVVAAAALGLIASDWAREVGVHYAPPDFDRTPVPTAASPVTGESGTAPPDDSGIVDPLAGVIVELR